MKAVPGIGLLNKHYPMHINGLAWAAKVEESIIYSYIKSLLVETKTTTVVLYTKNPILTSDVTSKLILVNNEDR